MKIDTAFEASTAFSPKVLSPAEVLANIRRSQDEKKEAQRVAKARQDHYNMRHINVALPKNFTLEGIRVR